MFNTNLVEQHGQRSDLWYRLQVLLNLSSLDSQNLDLRTESLQAARGGRDALQQAFPTSRPQPGDAAPPKLSALTQQQAPLTSISDTSLLARDKSGQHSSDQSGQHSSATSHVPSRPPPPTPSVTISQLSRAAPPKKPPCASPVLGSSPSQSILEPFSTAQEGPALHPNKPSRDDDADGDDDDSASYDDGTHLSVVRGADGGDSSSEDD